MIDDTRIRFLKAIASQLDVERIAEVHLFPAIRQGGMESGVAVLAVEPVRELVSVASSADAITIDAAVDAEALSDATTDALPVEELAGPSAMDEDAESPYAEQDPLHDDATADDDEEDVETEDAPQSRPAPRRFTVYSARYRHTLKGPDRGKWEVSVTEEADAPLLTVDAVVRGVQRRSGEVEEIVRMSGGEVVALTSTPNRE